MGSQGPVVFQITWTLMMMAIPHCVSRIILLPGEPWGPTPIPSYSLDFWQQGNTCTVALDREVLTDQPNCIWALPRALAWQDSQYLVWLLVLSVPVSLAWVRASAFCPLCIRCCSQSHLLGSLWICLFFPWSPAPLVKA